MLRIRVYKNTITRKVHRFYQMQEHGVTHLQYGLVGGLGYAGNGNKSAEYVRDAKLVKFPAESGDRFSPQAAKVLRFRLMDECWLQPGTLKLQVQLNSTSADP